MDLPHDWAVELPFDLRGDTNHGSKAIGRPFPRTASVGTGAELTIPASDQGRRIALELDGVFRDSVVWVNGHYIGREHSRATPASATTSPTICTTARRTSSPCVDATGMEGWWYEGAGIYRHVWPARRRRCTGHWARSCGLTSPAFKATRPPVPC